MSGELAKYDAACLAIQKAYATDECLHYRGEGAMLIAYGKQAKNKDIEICGMQIRMRAERRIGELMQAQRETVGLSNGNAGKGRPKLGATKTDAPKNTVPTLAEAGIDNHLAARARKLAAIPQPKFDAAMADWREQQTYRADRLSSDVAKRAKPRKVETARKPEEFNPDAIAVDLTRCLSHVAAIWPAKRSQMEIIDILRSELARLIAREERIKQ